MKADEIVDAAKQFEAFLLGPAQKAGFVMGPAQKAGNEARKRRAIQSEKAVKKQ